MDVIDTAANKVLARAPAGQAPQALVYVSQAVPAGAGASNLVQRANAEPVNIALKAGRRRGHGLHGGA